MRYEKIQKIARVTKLISLFVFCLPITANPTTTMYLVPDSDPPKELKKEETVGQPYKKVVLDGNRNILSISLFSKDGNRNDFGNSTIHKIVYEYDGNNNRVSEAYFDKEGRPTFRRGWECLDPEYEEPYRTTYKYDVNNNLIEVTDYYLDRNFNLRKKYNRSYLVREKYKYVYDDYGRILEEVIYDGNGEPISKKEWDDVHKRVYEYDEYGGIRVTTKWDKTGGLISKTFKKESPFRITDSLLFVSKEKYKPFTILAANISMPQEITEIYTDNQTIVSPFCSLVGDKVIFASTRGGGGIFSVRPDGSELTRLTERAVGGKDPVISPDGTKVAFASKMGGDYDIYIMDISGDNIKRLTDAEGDDYHPWYSADGKKIIFTSERRKGKPDWLGQREPIEGIYIMNNDGSHQKRLSPKDDYAKHAAFSAAQDNIIYVSSSYLKIMNLRSKDSTFVEGVPADGSQSEPVFSPDGKKIAFENISTSTNYLGIFIGDVGGTNYQKVPSRGLAFYPVFSPQLIEGRLLDCYGHWHEFGE